MKAGLVKKLLAASGAVILSITCSILPLAQAHAATQPYLKVFGGDVSSGGWFSDASGASCTSNANFQDNNYNGDDSYGGIYTFAQNPGSGYVGSSSQYGAFSLGKIDGGSAPNGFYSDSQVTPSTPSTLSFANLTSLSPSPAGYTGGLWGGTTRNSAQCIPDYYDTKKPTTTTALASGGFGTGNATGIAAFTADGTGSPFRLMSGDTTIAPSADISIFVDGNVYINHNIFYAGHNTTNIPRLALVARGNIFIDPSVTNLDGLYIAQPASGGTTGSDDGIIWTCHDGTTTAPTGAYATTACIQNNLTFNGAVIAKQVNLLRTKGDIAAATPGEALGNANVAETFNFEPEMLIAGPFFPTDSDISGSGTSQPVFRSILSLPPVF